MDARKATQEVKNKMKMLERKREHRSSKEKTLESY